MSKKQLGTDYILWVNTGTTSVPVWKAVMCQSGLTITTPFETIDASSKCGKDSVVDDGIETVEFDAFLLQKDDTDTDHMTTYEWRQLARTKDQHEFKAAPKTATAEDEGKIVYEFDGVITSVADAFPYKEMATVSSSISVKGSIVESEFVMST